jgi:hypothetical protein
MRFGGIVGFRQDNFKVEANVLFSMVRGSLVKCFDVAIRA